MLGCSPAVRIGTPHPLCMCSEGEDTLACGRGGGGSQFGRGDRHCGTLGIYCMYFVREFIPLDYFRRTPCTVTIKNSIGFVGFY